MTASATLPRHVRHELASLRSQWKLWKRGTHPTLHAGYCLVCPDKDGPPRRRHAAQVAKRCDARTRLIRANRSRPGRLEGRPGALGPAVAAR